MAIDKITGNPLYEKGKLVGYIGTTRDITEKKEYEIQLNKYINDLKAMNAKLEKMATEDVLTGVYNRRKFNDALSAIIEMKEFSISFSLIFFDIDNFKMINDSYGHKVGDRVLRSVSQLVKNNIRASDKLFRWGGEEFVLILLEANLRNAINVAEKIRNLIQYHDFGIGHNITISLGVGEYKAGESPDQMMRRVDEALRKAKSMGKNRVVTC
ncbi:MAG: diguanylate cyclase [Bacillota bacterium]